MTKKETLIVRIKQIYDNLIGTSGKPVPTKHSKNDPLGDRSIHPSLHIEPDFASVGVVIEKDHLILTSKGHYRVDDIKSNLSVRPMYHPELADRYRVPSSGNVSLSEALALLIDKWRGLQWFEDERIYPTIALWTAGTYVFEAFPAYPYLAFTGEKGSGKTKAEDILQCVAFNALKLIVVSPAVLFRTIHSLRPTILIDEAETMSDDLRAIVNAGYKKGATVPRCVGDEYQPQFFEVYSPKCLASIQGLGDVTEDRCVVLVMGKPPAGDDRQNKSIDSKDCDWATIRYGFYRLPLDYAGKIIAKHQNLPLPSWLNARERELWSPLLTVAAIADEESDLEVFDDVLGLAQELAKEKGLTFESEAILIWLEQKLATEKQDAIQVHPGDLCFDLGRGLNKFVTAEWIAGRLRSLGFKRSGRDAKGVVYEITSTKLLEIRGRHAVTVDPTSQDKPTFGKPQENTEEI